MKSPAHCAICFPCPASLPTRSRVVSWVTATPGGGGKRRSVAGFRIHLEFERWRVNCPRCGDVQVERLDWLTDNPRYTKRFALQVGNLCRDMSNKAVAELDRCNALSNRG